MVNDDDAYNRVLAPGSWLQYCLSLFQSEEPLLRPLVASSSQPRKRVSGSPAVSTRTAQMPPAPFSFPGSSPTEALVTKTVRMLGPPMQGQVRREAVGARHTRSTEPSGR